MIGNDIALAFGLINSCEQKTLLTLSLQLRFLKDNKENAKRLDNLRVISHSGFIRLSSS